MTKAAKGQKIAAADIDADNIEWCAANLKVRSICLPLLPPSTLDDQSYDLVIGSSVFTHLYEEAQFSWLQELRRTMNDGAVALVTVHNIRQMMFATQSEEVFTRLFNKGIIDEFRDAALDETIASASYYRATFHTHDYIRSTWSKWLHVKNIVTDTFGQDMVVLQKFGK